MPIKILGHVTDFRTDTLVLYAQMSITEYLALIGEDFDQFAIQRRREKHKAYARMKGDIRQGALLPPITLAVKPIYVPDLLVLFGKQKFEDLELALSQQGRVNILDGLQRTYILKDLHKEGTSFTDGQKLLLEFWLESNIQHLIYRIIVLNAGQKPMSMRHQIEVLFSTFKESLATEIEGLEIFVEREGTRRTRSRKYALDRIVGAYQSLLTKSPEVQKENVIAQRLIDEEILSDSEDSLSQKYELFKKYLAIYAELDDQICRVYDGSQGKQIPTGTSWFGNENVMNGFFAALADFGTSPQRCARLDNALENLSEILRKEPVGGDPLGLDILQQVTQGFNTRKVNVGFATRKLLVSSFKEYFREEGEKPLRELWATEAE